MPTYQFRCPDGTIVERVFKMSEVPETIPNPQGEGVAVRMISGGADLIFKGSGFYITDYGKDGKKDQRESASKGDAKPSSDKSSGGESKPSPAEGSAASGSTSSKPDAKGSSGSSSSSSASTSE
jgi:predicted nucleic acid-binding Zn ribbon protein